MRMALQAQVTQSRMCSGAGSRSLPVKFSIAGLDRQIIDRGKPTPHQPLRVELPILIAVGAKPVARIIMPFVGKAHRNAILGKRPQLLDQTVLELLGPFTGEKGNDGRPSLKELRAVAPYAVYSVGERHLFRIATVPAILGGAHLD